MHNRFALLFTGSLLSLALAGCSQSAPATPATPAPAAPTTEPASAVPTSAPTAAPTSAPTNAPATNVPAPTATASGVLPMPLFFVQNGNEIIAMDTDGTTATSIVQEPSSILELAVAPNDGSLAYLIIADDGISTTLVRVQADGSNRSELARGIMRGLAVAEDGSIQFGVVGENTTAADGTALQPGAWTILSGGGSATLLVAGTEPTQAADGIITPGTYYQPIVWSPDGSGLLLRTTPNFGPDAPGGDIGAIGLAVFNRASAETRLVVAAGQEPLCVDPAWATSSDAIFCANAAAVGSPTQPLWRLNLADGAQETIIPADEELVATLDPYDSASGLYVLVGEYTDNGLELAPQRISADGTRESLSAQPFTSGFGPTLWAPDGSGLVVAIQRSENEQVLVWQPFNGEAVELATGTFIAAAWAAP